MNIVANKNDLSKRSNKRIQGMYIILLLITAIPSVEADVFPDQTYNGMQITYFVSGAGLETPQDSGESRTIKGTITGDKLTVSGNVIAGWGWGAALDVTLHVEGQEDMTFHQEKSPEGGLAKDSMSQEFSVSLPVPSDAKTASFSINMIGNFNAGTRGLTVSGKLERVQQPNSCIMTGKYSWFNGHTIYILSDGTTEDWVGNDMPMHGTWSESGGIYTLRWQNDKTGARYIDTLRTSADCKSFSGSNNEGTIVTGTKISDTVPTTTPTSVPTPTPILTPVPMVPGVPGAATFIPGVPAGCQNYWGPIEPLHIADAGPRQPPGTHALFYAEIPKSGGNNPLGWTWRQFGNVVLKGGNRYYLLLGRSDRPSFFEETQLPPMETLVNAPKDAAIIWDENVNLEMRYAYCFAFIAPPAPTPLPGIGTIGVLSIIFLVYMIRKIKI